METRQPLFNLSKTAKDLILSNNHVDWSASNISFPQKQKPLDVKKQDPTSNWFVDSFMDVLIKHLT
ncbi:MAG: hypothetical protein JRJ39_00460 [Deltaproteobacteria bacterium]|nr:hypothetical protein [Deltaproteobacteria bacterium]